MKGIKYILPYPDPKIFCQVSAYLLILNDSLKPFKKSNVINEGSLSNGISIVLLIELSYEVFKPKDMKKKQSHFF